MYRRYLIALALLCAACSKPTTPTPNIEQVFLNAEQRQQLDELNIKANTASSASEKFAAFYELYKLSKVNEYLKSAAKYYSATCQGANISYGCDNKEFNALVQEQIPQSKEAKIIKIKQLYMQEQKPQAQKLALELLKSEPSIKNAELAILIGCTHKQIAKILDPKNEQNLFIISAAALANNDFLAALKYTKNSTNPALLINKLQALIALEQDLAKIISLAKELEPNSRVFFGQIAELLLKHNDAANALYFAQISHQAQLRANLALKNYSEASRILRSRYLKSGDKFELAYGYLYALMSGASSEQKALDRLLNELAFNADLANSYGYYLIDSDLNIKKGVNLVRKALKQSPENAYYMDSLAWGLYKLGRCDEALAAIERALELGVDPSALDELNEHLKEIKKCKN